MRQQFLVPQFIDVEDKIIGPITTRQFVIMLVGALLIFIVYQIFVSLYFIIISIGIIILFGILAFARINGMPFHFFLLNFFATLKRPAIRVWNKNLTDNELKAHIKIEKEEAIVEEFVAKPAVSTSQLSKLALVVNTGGAYKGDDEQNTIKEINI